jgi:hypothetical protein
LKSQSLRAHQHFGKSGFKNHGNKWLDTATTEIAIRRSPKEKEERSALTVFGFQRFGDKAPNHRIHKIRKSDLPRYKGEFLEVSCGCRFPEREIEDLL